MEPAPVMRYQLEFLASRLAWSRVLPGLALIVVGLTQPFALIEDDADGLVGDLSLGAVVGHSDTLTNSGATRVFAVLLILAVLALGAQSLSAMATRTDRSRQVTVGLAVLVLVLGVTVVGAIGELQPSMAAPGDSVVPDGGRTIALTARGPIPLLLGAIAVWVAAARTKRPERFLERTVTL